MENVKGLLSSKVSNDDTSVFQIILNKFTKLGYKTIFGILDAVNYGVPQFRERFILLGSRDGEDIFFPMPTHFHFHQNKDYRWVTLRTAIADLENNNSDCVSFSDERMKYLKYVPEGGNWRNLPKRLIKDAMGGAYLSGGGKVGFYRRLNYDEPSPTLVTSPVQKASMLCHPTQNRPLSINEYKKIQQFPDNWIFIGTVTEKYKQIGNAVPIGLAKAVGQTIISIADGTNIVKTKRFRGTSIHNKIMKALLRD
jgi:DNA (cytosine-5)-methyltransferase 1